MFNEAVDRDLHDAGDLQAAGHIAAHIAVADAQFPSHSDLSLSRPLQQLQQLPGGHFQLRQSSIPPLLFCRLAISRKSGCNASLASCHSVDEGGLRSWTA